LGGSHEIDADEKDANKIDAGDAARYGPLREDVNEVSMKNEGATMGAKVLRGRSLTAIGENKVQSRNESINQKLNISMRSQYMRTPLFLLLLMSSLVRR